MISVLVVTKAHRDGLTDKSVVAGQWDIENRILSVTEVGEMPLSTRNQIVYVLDASNGHDLPLHVGPAREVIPVTWLTRGV